MSYTSAGIMLFRLNPNPELFLAHPGGPYWTNKDEGAWSIPKGIIEEEEDKLQAAIREFKEEIGFTPNGSFIELGSVKQKGGKVVHAWAVQGGLPEDYEIKSNMFEIEWPPNTGKSRKYPEIDRAEFFAVEIARNKINSAQAEFIDRLVKKIK